MGWDVMDLHVTGFEWTAFSLARLKSTSFRTELVWTGLGWIDINPGLGDDVMRLIELNHVSELILAYLDLTVLL